MVFTVRPSDVGRLAWRARESMVNGVRGLLVTRRRHDVVAEERGV